jgi:hypothetical protein
MMLMHQVYARTGMPAATEKDLAGYRLGARSEFKESESE